MINTLCEYQIAEYPHLHAEVTDKAYEEISLTTKLEVDAVLGVLNLGMFMAYRVAQIINSERALKNLPPCRAAYAFYRNGEKPKLNFIKGLEAFPGEKILLLYCQVDPPKLRGKMKSLPLEELSYYSFGAALNNEAAKEEIFSKLGKPIQTIVIEPPYKIYENYLKRIKRI